MNTLATKIRGAFCLLLFAGINLPTTQAWDESSRGENEFLAVLRSDAPGSEKALACKNLAIHGSPAAVPDLAKLLPNPQLSSWARIALEAIPGEESNEALRNAAGSLDGRLLIGMINSLGVRRDTNAVDLLARHLKDDSAEVASAAAVALGHIGNEPARKTLQAALAVSHPDVRSAVAEGCVLCAERLWEAGDVVTAQSLYDEVRQTDVPAQRLLEATRGAILTRHDRAIRPNGTDVGDDDVKLLMETFRSPDRKMFQLALGTVREFSGDRADKALAAELSRTPPERAALIIQAMADRPDTVELNAVLKVAEAGDPRVRLSAIEALQRVGDDSCLSALLKIATGSDEELAEAAQQTLAVLPGDSVDGEIGVMLPTARGDRYRLLLQLVGQRRIDVVAEVEKALDHSDAEVRSAAFAALGETVSLNKLPVLISQLIRPSHAGDEAVARQALHAASIRMADREACAEKLADALGRAPKGAKTSLLEILADVGGGTALQTLANAAVARDPESQDAASRLLGKWNGVEAAPVLLRLADKAPAEKYRIRALRGYIGLARKFAMSNTQRAEMCRNAVNATTRTAEHQLVLDVLKLHPSSEGLQLAVELADKSTLKSAASATAMVIAQKLAGKGVDVGKLMAGVGLENVNLEIVDAKYGAGSRQKDVTAVLKKQAGKLPLITLASASYNASFGGDPAPGVVKQLKIEYRINGKSGKATFAENALIILPMPK